LSGQIVVMSVNMVIGLAIVSGVYHAVFRNIA